MKSLNMKVCTLIFVCCVLCPITLPDNPLTITSSPFEDNEGHKANHHGCQDGAVDGYKFVVEAIVDSLLGITVGGRGNRGSCCGTICGDLLW